MIVMDMKDLRKLYYAFGNLTPKGITRHIEEMLDYSGVRMDARVWFGSVLLLSLLFGVATLLFIWIVLEIMAVAVLLLVGIGVFLFTLFTLYLVLHFRVEDRRKRIENVLPDALQLIAANIRAGLTPLAALRISARPEFGPLEEEVRFVTAKSLGIESFTDALKEMSKRIKSEVLERTVALFIVSMRSGGSLAVLLENAADDILESQELRRQLIAGTNMYIVFILFAVLIGMPALLSISIEFVDLIGSLQAKGASTSLTSEVGLFMGTPISSDFLFDISIITIIVTSFTVSMLIGVIHDGNELNGLKYSLYLIVISLAVFMVIHGYILKSLLSVV
ncbi:MAG: Type II secretion system (T2SS), protein F [Candidatus Fermentimicrarchaeum limneticum]|uniref:Type II secretion system (T2SS), protein F n=1 Tax=Fermentimicrarchaeum limneticum TaxID=2795018 RepID=A0A7D5XQB9_FERL1|nr:MAG: Type II secretion system (T2SS), protein F [Candidatus Fermentimicrarchaeum limneticum]